MLPEEVLLEIFSYYVQQAQFGPGTEAWHTLVHVCRKWRCVVYGSPRRLNLRLICSARTPVRETLAVWPPLPIVIRQYGVSTCGEDNIVAALEHNGHVCDIRLQGVSSSLLEKVLAAMQESFPALTCLQLETEDDTAPVVPDSFLGASESTSHLRYLLLTGIRFPFPGLRKLFLSVTDLVHFAFRKIPHSGYISPEAMVTCISALPRLEVLHIEYESPRSRPPVEHRRLPHPRRSVLPALTHFMFVGVSEYFEDLVDQVDAPLLDHLDITFFHQLVYNAPLLAQFMSRTPKLKAPDQAYVIFSDSQVMAAFQPHASDNGFQLGISIRHSDWQLSSLAQVCTSTSFLQALVPTVEHLYILDNGFSQPCWQDDIENSEWLELLHPFAAVKHLYLSQTFAPRVAPALQELVGERATEVLPALRSIFLEWLHPSGFVPEAIMQFFSARRLSTHPIAVSHWIRQDLWLKMDDD